MQDMYEDSVTAVRCAAGMTDWFKVKVGLHQESALSSLFFAMVMDRLMNRIREEPPWIRMFADDIVICSESREQVEMSLKRWRYALDRRGMKVSRSKIEYMCINGREGSRTVQLQGADVFKVDEFKYLGSVVQSNGECGREAGWSGWRRVPGVICDRRVPARVKGKVYKTVVRPAMFYGLEVVLQQTMTRMDRIKNEYIRGTAQVGQLVDKVRETRLRWFGHVQRRDEGYVGRKGLRMEPLGRRRRGRPKRRFVNVVMEDMRVVGVREEDVEDRAKWRQMIIRSR
ncbi:hypothetical protein H4Q32_022673 [Labeo rohita]|uniref:ribonuclease H n=1 Tax=Labeo rohita TaxID=84645 RepID=A0ABQ8MCV8_LABRO|nr:hypothetical protein H4Q32_022673 [Labeo rohita]